MGQVGYPFHGKEPMGLHIPIPDVPTKANKKTITRCVH